VSAASTQHPNPRQPSVGSGLAGNRVLGGWGSDLALARVRGAPSAVGSGPSGEPLPAGRESEQLVSLEKTFKIIESSRGGRREHGVGSPMVWGDPPTPQPWQASGGGHVSPMGCPLTPVVLPVGSHRAIEIGVLQPGLLPEPLPAQRSLSLRPWLCPARRPRGLGVQLGREPPPRPSLAQFRTPWKGG